MRHFLSLKFDYFTNFPIRSNWLVAVKQKMKTPNKYNKKRTCKNIIIFLLFLKFLKKTMFKSMDLKILLNVFIQPSQQNLFNYLRAPYKNKLSRNQIYNPRFKLSFTLKFYKLEWESHTSPIVTINFINFFKKNLISFESNILYLNKIKVFYKSFFKIYWNYNN